MEKSKNKNFIIKNDVLLKYIGKDKDVQIPDDIRVIGECAFKDNVTLEKVSFPNTLKIIGCDAFQGCNNLKRINFAYGLTNIGPRAFLDCIALESIYLPDSLTTINTDAFANCISLKTAIIPNSIKKIGFSSFFRCLSLTNIVIPNGITKIHPYSFSECISLRKVLIPDSVERIGFDAFYECCSLTNIILPASVKKIGYDAFGLCYKLVEVCNKSDLNIEAGASGYGNVALYAKAVYKGEYISKLKIDNVGFAIYEDKNEKILVGYFGNKTNPSLPEDITEINDGAFYLNNIFYRIVIPQKVKRIGNSAFTDCFSLVEICDKTKLKIKINEKETNGGITTYARMLSTTECYSGISVTDEGYVIYKEGKTKVLVRYLGNETMLKLPDGITDINAGAFYGNKSVISVTMPKSLIRIGKEAFHMCSSLKTVNLNSAIINIADLAFGSCVSLTKLELPDCVQRIATSAFENCRSLKYINIPFRIKKIESWFKYCYNLTTVFIPNNVTEIFTFAFSDCYNLREIYYGGTKNEWRFIPKSMKEIKGKNVKILTVHCLDGDITYK